MSKPISSTPPSSPRNSVSNSESFVESSVDEKNKNDEKSNSAPKMNTKKSSQRKVFSSSKFSTSISIPKDSKTEFNKKIDEARQSYEQKNESWKNFIEKHISEAGYLYLHNTKDKELHALLNCLDASPNPKITSMCSRSATIDATIATALIKAIKSNPAIVTLEISYGWFDAAGLKIFTDSVISNPASNITTLILRYNNINDDLVKIIAKSIITNPNTKLTALDLQHNQIGNEGAKALAEAIETNPSNITELKLSLNFNSDEGAKFLVNAFKSNSAITLFEVIGPYVSNKHKQTIYQHAQLNALRKPSDHNTTDEKVNSAPYANKLISKYHFVIDTKEQPSKEKNNKKS
jgi:hypothetical protein